MLSICHSYQPGMCLSDKQHVATLLAMDGLTPCEEIVEAVLAPVEGDNKQILDIGMSLTSLPVT